MDKHSGKKGLITIKNARGGLTENVQTKTDDKTENNANILG